MIKAKFSQGSFLSNKGKPFHLQRHFRLFNSFECTVPCFL